MQVLQGHGLPKCLPMSASNSTRGISWNLYIQLWASSCCRAFTAATKAALRPVNSVFFAVDTYAYTTPGLA